MPIIAKDNRREFTPAPEGLHQAVCVDVTDLGLQATQWGEKQKVEIRWQLEEKDEETGKRFLIMSRYTNSLNEKATLRQHLEAWRGRRFTQEELEGFDLEKLLGVNCQLQVIHNIVGEGRVYANVQAIVPIGKGMTKIRPEDYVRVVDRAGATNVASNGAKGNGGNDDEAPF
jgi:hypothetical protein